MMETVEQGKIHCIILKDYSRWGRKYLQVGDYLEQFLPRFGVRYISIHDGYDSNKINGYTGGIDIAFKNLINDYYSKDEFLDRRERYASQLTELVKRKEEWVVQVVLG